MHPRGVGGAGRQWRRMAIPLGWVSHLVRRNPQWGSPMAPHGDPSGMWKSFGALQPPGGRQGRSPMAMGLGSQGGVWGVKQCEKRDVCGICWVYGSAETRKSIVSDAGAHGAGGRGGGSGLGLLRSANVEVWVTGRDCAYREDRERLEATTVRCAGTEVGSNHDEKRGLRDAPTKYEEVRASDSLVLHRSRTRSYGEKVRGQNCIVDAGVTSAQNVW